MDYKDAIRAAEQIGVAPGDHITLQSATELDHPHRHAGQTSGEPHVDAWKVSNNGGQLHAKKFHSS